MARDTLWCRVKLLLLIGLMAIMSAFPWLAWGQGSSPPQVTVFSTIDTVKPDGAIVRIDLSLLGSIPVLTGLSFPSVVTCGPDGKLYTLEQFRQTGGGRFFRVNQDGSNPTDILRIETEDTPASLTFDSAGNFYAATGNGNIVRLDKADPANQPKLVTTVKFFVLSMAFLTQGPFPGDLLVVDEDGKVIRLAAPDFTKATDFITRETAKVASTDRFEGAAVDPKGDVYVTDFDGGGVLQFGSDGTLKGTFLTIPFPNQLAFDSAGKLYLTNQVFFGGGQTRGGVLLVTPQGQVIVSLRIDKARGIALCER